VWEHQNKSAHMRKIRSDTKTQHTHSHIYIYTPHPVYTYTHLHPPTHSHTHQNSLDTTMLSPFPRTHLFRHQNRSTRSAPSVRVPRC
jgi:hypothetical protein